MPDLIDRIGAELVRAARIEPVPPAAESTPAPRGAHSRSRFGRGLRWRPLLITCGLLLAAAAAALAANLAFAPGTAVGPVVPPVPTANDGAAVPGTIRLLALSVPDPHGGLPWGIRQLRTTRGETCVQIGRLDYGTIGVLGQDGAFRNDHRFHPLSPNYLDGLSCAVDDGNAHAFIDIGHFGLPASASLPGVAATGDCLARPGVAEQTCPRADLRDVYYGLLGPDARSISYRSNSGRTVTVATAGPDGAYLIVLPARRHEQPGTAEIGPDLGQSPIQTVAYRGGRTCQVSAVPVCPRVGFVPAAAPRPTHALLASPVVIRKIPARWYCSETYGNAVRPCPTRVPAGFTRLTGARQLLVDISFKARMAVTSSRSYYALDLTSPQSRTCTIGRGLTPTESDIHAGERITLWQLVPYGCPGVYHGEVRYVQNNYASGPGLPLGAGLLVGRFSFRVP